jgi:DNA-binding transcriptional regulator YbjK
MSSTISQSAPADTQLKGDPRQRIIDATLQVITEQGLSGLSHRRVAKSAGVSLSATSYYFGALEDLLAEAFVEAIERDRRVMRARADSLPAEGDVIVGLAAIVHQMIEERATAVLANELWIAALRSERLRPLALAWDDSWRQSLGPRLGEATARAAVALMGGLTQRGLVSDPPLTVAELEAVLRRGLQPLHSE